MIRALPIVTVLIVVLLFAVACGDDEDAAPAPAPTTAPAPAPAATTAPAPAAPTAVPVPIAAGTADAPDPKNPVGTIQFAQSNLGCNPGAGTVFCSQYQAVAWGVGEDLFTWRWREDNTVEYAAGQLATAWDLASDGLSVTVDIRQGVEFHKGWGTMTAQDVAWSYNQVNPLITTHSIAPSASYFSTLFGENLAVASGNTVEYTFAAVDSHWHTYMMNGNGFVGMVVHPEKAQADNGEDWMRENFVGTGPFQVEEWIRDDRAVFTKSGHHWEFDPAVERVVILALPEDATRVAALRTGELDVASLAIKSVPEVLDAGFTSIGSGNASQQGVIFSGNLWETHNALTGVDLNTPANGVYARDIQWIGNPYRPNDGNDPDDLACPEGADPTQMDQSCGDMEQARLVRWAVAMAINKDTINEHLLNGLGWPVHVGYADEKSEFWQTRWEYPYDPAMAEEYLDKAGFPKNSSGVRMEMPLFISSGHTGGLGEEIGDAIGGMMTDIGIKTEVLKFPYAVYRPGLVNRSATVPRLTSGDDGQTIYPFDWPKGIEESSLSRGGYCMCYETEWISQIYLDVAEENDPQKRIGLNSEYFDLMHFWALKPGVVAVPNLTIYNPKSIDEWVMEPSPFGTTAFWNIVPASR
jgi:ABC-type transport system substrate-binding protein